MRSSSKARPIAMTGMFCCISLLCGYPAYGQLNTVRAHVEIKKKASPKPDEGVVPQPHVLVVPVGSAVDFPNRDPFFHNVFSLFDGKRFDLGLYEAGASNSVRFDRLGVSFLFCNIHPEMSAVVIAVDTPYYGVSDRAGNITVSGVPDGTYEVHVWHERSLAEDLKN